MKEFVKILNIMVDVSRSTELIIHRYRQSSHDCSESAEVIWWKARKCG